jgi:hypothetical protein
LIPGTSSGDGSPRRPSRPCWVERPTCALKPVPVATHLSLSRHLSEFVETNALPAVEARLGTALTSLATAKKTTLLENFPFYTISLAPLIPSLREQERLCIVESANIEDYL